jgi:hypothetical protein
MLRIYDKHGQLLVKVQCDVSCLYHLQLLIGQPVCLSARCSEVAWLWHGCYGHLNFGTLRWVVNTKMVQGLSALDQVDQVCDDCLIGK